MALRDITSVRYTADMDLSKYRLKLFWKKVQKLGPIDCWIWLGCKYGSSSYGAFWNGHYMDGAHRYSLEIKLGRRLEEGEMSLHTCDNRLCVNPNHLFPGNSDDNSKDMVAKGRKEKGEYVYGAALTDDEVLETRTLFATLKYSMSELGKMFNVTPETLYHVIRGNTWKHIGGPLFIGKIVCGPKIHRRVRLRPGSFFIRK